MKEKIKTAFNDHTAKSFAYTQVFLAIVTVISITSIILETVVSLQEFHYWFLVLEWFAVIIFSVEYVARLTVTTKKFSYVFSFWGLIDIISIAPTFLNIGNLTFLKSLRELRIMRLLRVFRLAKVSRMYLQTHTSAEAEEEITRIDTVIYFLALFSSIVAFGSALYAVEHQQSGYANIPLAMIEAAKILLGGLGQVPATTVSGEIIILVCRLVGLALFGLLISIVGKGLNQLLFGQHENKK